MSEAQWQGFLLAGFFAFIVLPAFLTDRRRKSMVEKLLHDPRRIRHRVTPVATSATPDEVLAAGATVLRRWGARDVREYEGSNNGGRAVIGWKGDMWTNIPSRAQYQLIVIVDLRTDGGTDVACCARPRFVMNFLCEGQASVLGAQLAAGLREQLASA